MGNKKQKKKGAKLLAGTFIHKLKGYKDYQQIRSEFDNYTVEGFDLIHTYCTTQKRLAEKILRHSKPRHSKVIDFGCGSGLSGEPFIEKGFTVDGIEFATKLAKGARDKGYSKIFDLDLSSGSLDVKGYDIAIAVGVVSEYLTADYLLPKMTKALGQDSLLGFTSEASMTDVQKLEKILGSLQLDVLSVERESGPAGCPGFSNPLLANSDYYFVVARR